MRNQYANVACGGMDVHYKFSTLTFRDADARVVVRETLRHEDRKKLREQLSRWPRGVPIVMEASFGWGWLSDEMEKVGLDPQLSNCYKVEQNRKAKGQVKTNQKDADLLSELPFEKRSWWKVWRAPPEVRDRREWMRYRAVPHATEACGVLVPGPAVGRLGRAGPEAAAAGASSRGPRQPDVEVGAMHPPR